MQRMIDIHSAAKVNLGRTLLLGLLAVPGALFAQTNTFFGHRRTLT